MQPSNPTNGRRWWVLAAVSLMFFFVSGATFSSLGVVLFTMAAERHWSMAAAGASFSVLGLACCFASPLPGFVAERIGSRFTLVTAALVLAAGFLLARAAEGLAGFYVAMALLGVGFALAANIPGVFLLSGWFRERAARVIGVYLMFGAFGGVVAPPVVQALVAAQGWPTHWLVMAACAVALAAFCSLAVRDVETHEHAPAAHREAAERPAAEAAWSYREGLATPQFAVLALAMVITQTTLTTLNGVAVPHFTQFGSTASFAALMLGLQALLATLAKGLSGVLAERFEPRLTLIGGLLIHAVGLFTLGVAHTHEAAYLFAVTFGLGWGSVYLSVTVMVMRWFGRETGTALMSTVWLLTGIAAAGPALAGWIGDRYGTFVPVFDVCGLLLIPLALAAFLMPAPWRRPVAALQPVSAS